MPSSASDFPPPPGFVAFDECKPLTVYKRHLPHWRQHGATYFVTFHLADAIPESAKQRLQELRNECLSSRDSLVQQQLARALFQETERALDKGIGSAVFANPRYADELHRSILHFHEIRYEIGAYVVMSNHCHLVMRPFGEHKLENLVGAIKSVVAVSISSETSSHGRLWFEESYDRIVRDVDHLYRVVQYIGHNPAKAGVPRQGWRRWINPDWQSAGWNFD